MPHLVKLELPRSGCSPQPYDPGMSENEGVVRRFYDLFNDGDVAGAAQQYAEQCEWDFPAFAATCRTRNECWRSVRIGGSPSPTAVWTSSICSSVVTRLWSSGT